MKQITKKILTLFLAFSVMAGSAVTLSSCSFMVEDFIDYVLDKYEDTDGEGGVDSSVPNTETNPGDNGTSSEGAPNESGSGGNGIDFYPGQGSVGNENISALNRTLLSTVVVHSHFGNTPSAGSGIIYSLDKERGDAYIVTNYHVVHSKDYGVCDSAELYLYGMRYEAYKIPAKVVGGSVTYDIAVLKVVGSDVLKNSYAMAASLGNSDDVKVFDEVYAVGNPEGYGIAVTEGIVSVDSESLNMAGSDGTAIELRVMRVSAAINEGNSGGGIYDTEGRLVGIVVAKRIGSEIDNMGYAIPVNLAKNLAENIIYFCDGQTKTKLLRPLIGITITASNTGVVIDPEDGSMVKAEIVEITELTDTCIAKGKVLVGDVINSISVDGVKVGVTRLHHVTDHMLTARVGSSVVMEITREGKPITMSFTVPESAFSEVK